MSDRKPTFFTSDWHIGHAKSIEFDRRPFPNVEEMHKALIRRYNSSVPWDGVCYFLGDIGLGGSKETHEVIRQLNGTKVLVLGNHDKNPYAMYKYGFDVVLHGCVLYIQGERVTMSHCPLRDVFREDTTGMGKYEGEPWHGNIKNAKYSFKDEGQFHLHGHIHSGPSNNKGKILGRQYDVGVPANNYSPVSISTIESWIDKTIKTENK